MAESAKKDSKTKTTTTKKTGKVVTKKPVVKNVATKSASKAKTTKKVAKKSEKEVTKTTTEVIDTRIEAKAVVEVTKVADDSILAKAGKRSAKALKEIEEKEAKEARKAISKETSGTPNPKTTQKPPRTKLERKGKKYRKLFEQIYVKKQYSLDEALELAVKTSPTKFDASVELHIRLGVDPKQADQNIRAHVSLPSGTGKSVRVAVYADDSDVAKAKKAGADVAAADEFLQQLDKGTVNFDILIATPAVMSKLSKYAKLLGPKGLMPNPKSGTVTTNIEKAVIEAKAGKVEYRVDSSGIVHVAIGKVSFGAAKLLPNAQAVLESIKTSKPASLKGVYVLSQYVTTSMGPSIAVNTNQ